MALSNALEVLHRRLARRWNEIPDGAEGLSWNAFKYLRAVDSAKGRCRAGSKRAPPGSPHSTDVTSDLGIKRPSASAMLRKLEQQGLVERAACAADARAQHVFLTRKGAAAVKQSAALYARSARTMTARLNARESKTLQKLLEQACGDA